MIKDNNTKKLLLKGIVGIFITAIIILALIWAHKIITDSRKPLVEEQEKKKRETPSCIIFRSKEVYDSLLSIDSLSNIRGW